MRPGLTREARVFRALAHPTRLAILQILRHRPVCVCHLTTALSCTQPYVSQHLAVLRQRKVVVTRREGLNIHYRISNPKIIKACNLMRQVLVEQLQAGHRLTKRLKAK